MIDNLPTCLEGDCTHDYSSCFYYNKRNSVINIILYTLLKKIYYFVNTYGSCIVEVV